ERPHHIEFQILADKHGNIIHLGERDCSIQRRHQKLIEIAPSLVLDKELRARMGEAAIAVAKAVNYDNAGTVEFILDPNRNFYFIEMNTRIQVEHTVTEQITAIDLVRSQIEIAAGLPLEFCQEDVTLQGHAIQCRINAEDPRNNFRPCTGTVTAYFSPGGIGVRIDGMVYKDYTIPPYYDALLAKLVVRGRTWEETVSRAHRSLEEFVLRGVKTTKTVRPAPLELEAAPAKQVLLTDVALRDGHQSLLATRMRTEDMLEVADRLDKVGLWSLEVWGGATFDTCLRFLKEDPWER